MAREGEGRRWVAGQVPADTRGSRVRLACGRACHRCRGAGACDGGGGGGPAGGCKSAFPSGEALGCGGPTGGGPSAAWGAAAPGIAAGTRTAGQPLAAGRMAIGAPTLAVRMLDPPTVAAAHWPPTPDIAVAPRAPHPAGTAAARRQSELHAPHAPAVRGTASTPRSRPQRQSPLPLSPTALPPPLPTPSPPTPALPHPREVVMPCVVGLTGGIASGKSTVSRRLAAHHGIPVIDADAIAREVVAPGQPALWLIRRAFGPSVIAADGRLDRPRLGALVFGDPAARRRLDRITHPFIIATMAWRLGVALLVRRAPVVVLDTPLLFETRNLLPLCTVTVVVSCTRAQQLSRLLSRSEGALTETQANERIAAQMALEDKAAMADFVVDNSGIEDRLPEQVDHFVATVRIRVPSWLDLVIGRRAPALR